VVYDDVGVGQNFIACDWEQVLLLPPSLSDWLPEDHRGRHPPAARMRRRPPQRSATALPDSLTQSQQCRRFLAGLGG